MWRFGRHAAGIAFALLLAACGQDKPPPGMTDIKGVMPSLQFQMHRANDDAPVSERDYRGKIALLYFGYTHCPDICPTTLSNLSISLNMIGDKAKKVRVLFVSVDPNRDTVPVLKAYVNAFSPEIDGLRGTPNQIADLARRYRVAFSVTPGTGSKAYEVTHSNAVYFFDTKGKARLVTMDTGNPVMIAQAIDYLIDSNGN